jgi:hypothetical protein
MTMAVNSFGQPTVTTPSIKTDYLQRGKRQETAAWIMFAGGMVVGLTGVLIAATNWDSDTGPVIAAIGFTAEIASIPLFIAASKNKKKARTTSAFFEIEKMPIAAYAPSIRKSFPALSIKIYL